MAAVADPVGDGLVQSLARPGGNITGLSFGGPRLPASDWSCSRSSSRRAAPVAVLWDGNRLRRTGRRPKCGPSAGGGSCSRWRFESWRDRRGLQTAAGARAGALLVLGDRCSSSCTPDGSRSWLRGTGYPHVRFRRFVEAGGLISYGAGPRRHLAARGGLRRQDPEGRQARRPAGRAAHEVRLVINLKTAKALGLTIPPSLLARADQVIE